LRKKDEFFIAKQHKEKEKNIMELTCDLFIKPKEKKDLEIQNNGNLFIERLKPVFRGQKSRKQLKDSFNILSQKPEKQRIPFTELDINKNEFSFKSSNLPCKKSAENKIEKIEEVNIPSININEEYIVDLINKSNLEGEKFNLHSKKKEKGKKEFIQESIGNLFFAGIKESKEKEKEDIKSNDKTFINLIPKKENDFIINKEMKPLQNVIKVKEYIKIKDKTFINLMDKKECEFIINKEIKPIIKPQNQIKQEESIFIPKKELSQDKLYLIFLEKWKKEKLNIQTIVKFKIENQKPKEIVPLKKEEKPEIQKQNINLIPYKLVSLNLEGNITPEFFEKLIILKTKYMETKNNIQPKSEINIFIPKKERPSEKNLMKEVLASTQFESFNLEGNISKKDFEDLITFKKNYLLKKDQIQPGGNLSLSISPQKSKELIPLYSDITKAQLWIKGKQKKPNIIENKGYFIINSSPRPSKNLIVRGTCFGLLAKPKKPGLVPQDFGIIPQRKENSKQVWNKSSKVQRSQFFYISGNDNKITWNKLIKRQKCVKFNIPPGKIRNDEIIIPEKINNIIYIGNKSFEQEIKNEDYNYNTLEKDKDEKQKRVVKSTISKIIHEPQFEDSQEEFDPFPCCKKREKTKYDKIFQERKTASGLMKENNDINSNIISPSKGRITENIRSKEDDEIKLKDKKERNSDLNLIGNKNKNKKKTCK